MERKKDLPIGPDERSRNSDDNQNDSPSSYSIHPWRDELLKRLHPTRSHPSNISSTSKFMDSSKFDMLSNCEFKETAVHKEEEEEGEDEEEEREDEGKVIPESKSWISLQNSLYESRQKSVEKKPEPIEEEKPTYEAPPDIVFPDFQTILKLNFDEKILKKLCFVESLIVSYSHNSSKSDKRGDSEYFPKSTGTERTHEIGGVCIRVEHVDDHIVTYCSSQFSLIEKNVVNGSLFSLVNMDFELIEEKKIETLCSADKKTEKSLHVAKNGSNCIVFRKYQDGDVKQKDNGNITGGVVKNLILDGCSILLMRYLIVTEYEGSFETWSMHISAEICRCRYVVGKKKALFIENKSHLVTQIKKIVYRAGRKPDVIKLLFFPSGHIARQKWKNSNYFYHINPLSVFSGRYFPSRLEKQWEQNIQLMSEYLDRKEKHRSDIETYLDDNPKLRDMIQDYVVCLLQLKPRYVLDFTVDYFLSLSCATDQFNFPN